VQTPEEIVDRMLVLAEPREGDVLYDLGSGDGRIVLAAARTYGIRAVGLEIDPDLVSESRKAVTDAGLQGLVEIREQDFLTADLSPASIVTLYLFPAANIRLRSILRQQLRPGARVVSHEFGMGSWTSTHTERMTDLTTVPRLLHLWRI
jgi:cyclopropane fatty-acyl-phospholipid synthase-like methyltransferase